MLLSSLSKKRLFGVHPDLVRVVARAEELASIADMTFAVSEGLRTIERQKRLVAAGLSQTMHSRHITGHAVDLVMMVDLDGDGKLEDRWDWPGASKVAEVMKQAARDLNVPLEWGGDWVHFKDGPHFQLPKDKYPAAV
jgi:peptidoglycan L-alanyl-D-glutamate endopeptidase CwlK